MAIKKARELANQDRNRKIEQMDMEELKRYLCMKNGQKPEKCDGCPGLVNCKAGQRAMVLLNQRDKERAEQEKAEHEASGKGITRAEARERGRRAFIVACQQDDMVGWVMKQEGITREAARQRLKYYAARCPELAEQYGFCDKLEAQKKRAMPANHNSVVMRNKAIEMYKEARKQEDPVRYLMDKYGLIRKNAFQNYKRWELTYGDIPDDKEEATPVAGQVEKQDEISIEDFLSGMAEEKEPQDKNADENHPVTGYIRVTANPISGEAEFIADGTEEITGTVVAAQAPDEKKLDFLGELNAKFRELERERERIDAEIERLRDRGKWIEKAQDSLAMVANIFNPESAIGKAVSAEE